jgi:hypothetical protein
MEKKGIPSAHDQIARFPMPRVVVIMSKAHPACETKKRPGKQVSKQSFEFASQGWWNGKLNGSILYFSSCPGRE